MKNICILTLILFFFSCQKSELDFVEIDNSQIAGIYSADLPENFIPAGMSESHPDEKTLFTTYPILQSTQLLSHDWPSTDNFQDIFMGHWKALQVIAINAQNQIVHLDYSNTNIEYFFSDICRVTSYNQFHCRYSSTNEQDNTGFYEVISHLGKEYLFMLPEVVPAGEPSTLKERSWGEILFWPGRKDIMVIWNDDAVAPYWLIFQKQITG